MTLDAHTLRTIQTCDPMTAAELHAEIVTSHRLGLLDWSATLGEVEASLRRLEGDGLARIDGEGRAEYVPQRAAVVQATLF